MIIPMIVALVALLGIAAYLGYRNAPIHVKGILGVDWANGEDQSIIVSGSNPIRVIPLAFTASSQALSILSEAMRAYADSIGKAFLISKEYNDLMYGKPLPYKDQLEEVSDESGVPEHLIKQVNANTNQTYQRCADAILFVQEDHVRWSGKRFPLRTLSDVEIVERAVRAIYDDKI